MNSDTITINGEEWVRKSSIPQAKFAVDTNGLKYCIIRANEAGVFAGYLKEKDGDAATVLNARRIWYWDGAATLSELAMHGVSKPENCKFPCEVAIETIFGVIEIIPTTEEAQRSIQGVPVWSARTTK